MKRGEIKIGGLYTAKVNGRLVTVRVDAILGPWGRWPGVRYDVTNLATGRKTTFQSAAQFRRNASENEIRVLKALRETVRILRARHGVKRTISGFGF